MAALIGGETNVGTLAGAAGLSESAVSHHMRNLRQLRMVRARKDGRQVFYSLDDQHIIDLFLRGVAHIQSGD
jgi:ArsR family transcriptional regulator